MRLHIRHVPFDFVEEQEIKPTGRVLAGMVFLLVVVGALLFATIFSTFAAADEESLHDQAGVQSGRPAAAASNLLPMALGGVASVLLIGAARRRAAHLDL